MLATATLLPAQSLPASVPADTLVVAAPFTDAPARGPALATGERVVVWPEVRVRVGAPEAGGRPVPDAPPGALVASFGGGPPFAWPHRPTVWTAPRAGTLAFGLNGRDAHALSGSARVAVVRLSDAARAAFPAPVVTLGRMAGGIRVAYRDRAGFGIDRRSLAFILTTSHGVVHRLAAWAPAGDDAAILPLPPPVALPPGVHTIRAEISDHLGNTGRSGAIIFDTR